MSTVLPAFTMLAGTTDDLDEVMTVMAAAFDPRFGEAWTRSQCAGIMTLPGVFLLLARADDGAAGFALARVIEDEAELLLLAVAPPMRRRGCGAALLDAVADTADRRGACRLFLEMRDGNDAIALYAAAGFATIGRRRAYYRGRDGRPIDAVTLGRRLGGLERGDALPQ